MADASGLESFLGIPIGSTPSAKELKETKATLEDIKESLTTAKDVKNQTLQLQVAEKRVEVLEKLSGTDLVKFGLTPEQLELDKERIREESFKVYEIASKLLTRYSEEIENLVDVNDRMWASGAKLIDSLTGSLDKLANMTLKFKQEAQMNALMQPEVEDETNNEKDMSPKDWISFIEAVQDDNKK